MAFHYLSAGESHGPCLSVIVEGVPAGLPLDAEQIAADLAKRQLKAGAGGRMAIETDRAEILAGVMQGVTTGAPIALQIVNKDHAAWKGKAVTAYTTARPGHADLAACAKYGFNDIRQALERSSARETACRVAVGAIARQFLAAFGIKARSYVHRWAMCLRWPLTMKPPLPLLKRRRVAHLRRLKRMPIPTRSTSRRAKVRPWVA